MPKKTRKPLPDWDDGRTVCPMDADGMPWSREGPFARMRKEQNSGESKPEETMSRQQLRIYTRGAVRAGLLIVGVFSVALILFTLFCTKIWFRTP